MCIPDHYHGQVVKYSLKDAQEYSSLKISV